MPSCSIFVANYNNLTVMAAVAALISGDIAVFL